MKRCRRIAVEAVATLTFAAVALAFRPVVRLLPHTPCHPSVDTSFRGSPNTGAVRARFTYSTAKVGRAPSGGRDAGIGGRFGGVVMMARANRQQTAELRQKKLRESAQPFLSEKAKRKAKRQANRERREYFREKFANSGRRLIELQKADSESFYIGFVGTNSAGRAQALKAVESFLRRATQLKVARHYEGDATIKLVDAGSVRISEMTRRVEHKLALLRRCDLFVHVVRCFDLHAPLAAEPSWANQGQDYTAGDGMAVSSYLGGGSDDLYDEDIVWPLAPTPLEDIRSIRADMAFADLRFIEERQKTNHTSHFWRNRRRGRNEQAAVQLVTPMLEDIYVMGGDLKPVGRDFRSSCLKDERREDGTVLSRSFLRGAIREIGFLSPKPVVYVANVPSEAARSLSEDPDDTKNASDEAAEETAEDSESSVAAMALKHAEEVTELRRKSGIPTVTACLREWESREALGAAVFKAIPRAILSLDPKKVAKSAALKANQQE